MGSLERKGGTTRIYNKFITEYSQYTLKDYQDTIKTIIREVYSQDELEYHFENEVETVKGDVLLKVKQYEAEKAEEKRLAAEADARYFAESLRVFNEAKFYLEAIILNANFITVDFEGTELEKPVGLYYKNSFIKLHDYIKNKGYSKASENPELLEKRVKKNIHTIFQYNNNSRIEKVGETVYNNMFVYLDRFVDEPSKANYSLLLDALQAQKSVLKLYTEKGMKGISETEEFDEFNAKYHKAFLKTGSSTIVNFDNEKIKELTEKLEKTEELLKEISKNKSKTPQEVLLEPLKPKVTKPDYTTSLEHVEVKKLMDDGSLEEVLREGYYESIISLDSLKLVYESNLIDSREEVGITKYSLKMHNGKEVIVDINPEDIKRIIEEKKLPGGKDLTKIEDFNAYKFIQDLTDAHVGSGKKLIKADKRIKIDKHSQEKFMYLYDYYRGLRDYKQEGTNKIIKRTDIMQTIRAMISPEAKSVKSLRLTKNKKERKERVLNAEYFYDIHAEERMFPNTPGVIDDDFIKQSIQIGITGITLDKYLHKKEEHKESTRTHLQFILEALEVVYQAEKYYGKKLKDTVNWVPLNGK